MTGSARSFTEAQANEWHALLEKCGAELENGEVERAAVSARQALALVTRVLGGGRPEEAVCLGVLAVIAEMQGNLPEAEVLFTRTLAIDEETMGPDAPEVATTLTHLARICRALGREQEAARLEQRAADIRAAPEVDDDDPALMLVDMSDAKLAADFLQMCAQAADTGSVSLESVQSVSNLRATSQGRFLLTPEAIADCEETIRKARKEGHLASKLKDLDPSYVAYLCGEIPRPTVPSKSFPVPGRPMPSSSAAPTPSRKAGCMFAFVGVALCAGIGGALAVVLPC